jgi:hypothetical protein
VANAPDADLMKRLPFLALMALITACAPSSNRGKEQAAQARPDHQTEELQRATEACLKFDDPKMKMEVGISAYESCLGRRANLTHPANRELCALAQSKMSADGTCVLAE